MEGFSCTAIKDINANSRNMNIKAIILETTNFNTKSGEVHRFKISDETAKIDCALFEAKAGLFKTGDIVFITRAYAKEHRRKLTLYKTKEGSLLKIGEFTMVFNEENDMSAQISEATSKEMAKNESTIGKRELHALRGTPDSSRGAFHRGKPRPGHNQDFSRPDANNNNRGNANQFHQHAKNRTSTRFQQFNDQAKDTPLMEYGGVQSSLPSVSSGSSSSSNNNNRWNQYNPNLRPVERSIQVHISNRLGTEDRVFANSKVNNLKRKLFGNHRSERAFGLIKKAKIDYRAINKRFH